MLVSRTIPALYGGVSQQPETLRGSSQVAAMVNSWTTVVDGIGKRAPTEFIARIGNTVEDAHCHMINRDTTERYSVVITNGDLKVVDLNGDIKTVAFPYGKEYLQVPEFESVEETFSCVTVADYTFVLNKRVRVRAGEVDSDRTADPTDYMAVTRKDPNNPREQYPPNPVSGYYAGTIQTFQDLPNNGAEGSLYKIQANQQSGFVGYYVQRIQGLWVEVTRPGAQNAIDATTMPWALVRLQDGTFEFTPFSWAPRRVGDETTNPAPRFMGRYINDIFFAESRLGICVDEDMLLSRAGDFGNFWRMSAVDNLDDDTVSVAATETEVTAMRYAIPMGDSLMLFSDQTQIRFTKGQYLTPTSGALQVTTRYPIAVAAKPAALGTDIYFGSEESGFIRLLEYYVRDEAMGNDASDVTGHVPRFIPKGLRCIATSNEHDAVFLLTRGAENRIYHYKFYWSSPEEKAQSAWGYWEFAEGTRVLSARCLGEYLYLVIARDSGTYLERINMSAKATAYNMDYEIHLDQRAVVSGTYFPAQDVTIFNLPYALTADDKLKFKLVRGNTFGPTAGGLIDPSSYTFANDSTVYVPGNLQGMCHAGLTYVQRFTFSRWFMRNSNGDPDLSGRLQIRTVTLYYTRAGYFQTEVAPYGTDVDVEAIVPAKLAEFTGKTLGSANLLLGAPTFDNGSYSFQIYGNAEDSVISISNDSHLGSWFTSAEVEFFWQKRSRFQ